MSHFSTVPPVPSAIRLGSLIACVTAALLFAGAAHPAPPGPSPSWEAQGWASAKPEEMGLSSEVLTRLIDFGAATQMDSLLVTRHGRILTEVYYAPFKAGQRHRLNSATKGVTAALVGAAIQAGHLDGISAPAAAFFPGNAIAIADARKREIRVQHLLDMTSGLDWDEPLTGKPVSAIEMERTLDWVRYVLERPMKNSPGLAFNYNSGNTQLLSAIVTRATGMRAERFAVESLFQPMGIVDFDWNVDPTGLSTGGFGLQMTTRDMAKLGYLYLQDGMWNGKRLLPKGWTDRPRQSRIAMNLGTPDDFFYADGWWVAPKRGLLMLAGMNRQAILLQPSKGLVVVTTGRAPWRWERFFDLLESAIRSDRALPPAPGLVRALRAREEAAASRVP